MKKFKFFLTDRGELLLNSDSAQLQRPDALCNGMDYSE